MIHSALLWHELFSTTLSYLGFKINPYEHCIANKMINENQCTIGWFIYYNKISHMNDSVNSMITDKIEEKFRRLLHTTGNKKNFPWCGYWVYWRQKSCTDHATSHRQGFRRFQWNPKSNCSESCNLTTFYHHQCNKRSYWLKEGALPLNNHQYFVDHEAITTIIGYSGIFSMHKSPVTNKIRLG